MNNKRYIILNKYGGVYLDMDIICLKSFKDLYDYDFVMGVQNNYDSSEIYGLCNAVILSKKNSKMIMMTLFIILLIILCSVFVNKMITFMKAFFIFLLVFLSLFLLFMGYIFYKKITSVVSSPDESVSTSPVRTVV